jgi:hypothetical protein
VAGADEADKAAEAGGDIGAEERVGVMSLAASAMLSPRPRRTLTK